MTKKSFLVLNLGEHQGTGEYQPKFNQPFIMDFGHTTPLLTLPIGGMLKISANDNTINEITILC